MTIRPAYPVGKDFRDWHAEATNARVERNREQAANGEVPDLAALAEHHHHEHDHDHVHDHEHAHEHVHADHDHPEA